MATILIVDDDRDILTLLVDLFEELGHTVACARHGAEALALARERSFDLILSDVMMPIMDGFTFAQQLRAEPTLITTPLFLMSAAAANARIAQVAPAITGYIQKPFDITVIEQLLGSIIGTEGRQDDPR